jgi:thiamine-phosphate pyrophosphorylase
MKLNMRNSCLLYFITDRSQFGGDECARYRALLDKVAEAARAGVNYIQLREKDLNTREVEKFARDVVAVLDSTRPRTGTREQRTQILVNSRTDIALAAGADGVHLRGDDIAISEVRQISEVNLQLRPSANHFLVAKSCHSAAEVQRAESERADFIVFAPVFEKNNSTGTRPAGIAALREACRAKIPVLALGGVTLENAASCLDAGAAGIAGIRLFQDNKIEDVVGALRAL